ncbi:DUF4190 domain-containing protein [Nocardioides sp.]|uniref:DUF4190 domain-containing protein n=1 Tax=Nocardioides sp. TaxID=35761 RepID=UPI001A2670B6|nr:DUF4190 domain-containing protein [Nocardioides sp.]MBJ7358917.1 DUF4190 domain-containing protein [Nocardioides sp.]
MTGSGDGRADEPEETMPFTHRAYGTGEPDNPFTSPSGAASQPSGPGYVPPPAPPPPMSSPPYGPPQPGQTPGPAAGWGTGWTPAYGAPLAGGQDHPGAQKAMVLGIVSMVCLGLSLFCCVTIPGVFAAPFAWVVGARAKREIDASPGVYRNRGAAQAGVIMGIIGSTIGVLMVLAIVAFAVLIGSGWSLV